MDLLLLIVSLLLCLIGIVGSFLPIIPGPLTSWLGILLLNLTSAVEFNLNFVLITFTVAVSVGILDYIIPILGVKKLGGSRSGQIGTTVGLIVALVILGPIGIIVGPFLGALLGEMSTNKSFQNSFYYLWFCNVSLQQQYSSISYTALL